MGCTMPCTTNARAAEPHRGPESLASHVVAADGLASLSTEAGVSLHVQDTIPGLGRRAHLVHPRYSWDGSSEKTKLGAQRPQSRVSKDRGRRGQAHRAGRGRGETHSNAGPIPTQPATPQGPAKQEIPDPAWAGSSLKCRKPGFQANSPHSLTNLRLDWMASRYRLTLRF